MKFLSFFENAPQVASCFREFFDAPPALRSRLLDRQRQRGLVSLIVGWTIAAFAVVNAASVLLADRPISSNVAPARATPKILINKEEKTWRNAQFARTTTIGRSESSSFSFSIGLMEQQLASVPYNSVTRDAESMCATITEIDSDLDLKSALEATYGPLPDVQGSALGEDFTEETLMQQYALCDANGAADWPIVIYARDRNEIAIRAERFDLSDPHPIVWPWTIMDERIIITPSRLRIANGAYDVGFDFVGLKELPLSIFVILLYSYVFVYTLGHSVVEYVVFNITLRESFRVFFALYTILVCLVVIGMTVLSSISVSDDLWLTLSIIMLIMLSILFAHHLVSMSGFRQGAPEGPGVLKRTAAVGGALVWTWTGGAVVFVPIVVAIVEFYPVISEMI